MLKKGDIVQLPSSSSLFVFTGKFKPISIEFYACNTCYMISNTCHRCADSGPEIAYEFMNVDGSRYWYSTEMIIANDKKQQFQEERCKYIIKQQEIDNEIFDLQKNF
ncbi:MAG: hypothetical protein WD512_00510 [Candidatus Paceibacterota bacterium]